MLQTTNQLFYMYPSSITLQFISHGQHSEQNTKCNKGEVFSHVHVKWYGRGAHTVYSISSQCILHGVLNCSIIGLILSSSLPAAVRAYILILKAPRRPYTGISWDTEAFLFNFHSHWTSHKQVLMVYPPHSPWPQSFRAEASHRNCVYRTIPKFSDLLSRNTLNWCQN